MSIDDAHSTDDRGRRAPRPARIPWSGWKRIGVRVFMNLGAHNISLVAAGMALFGILAVFPALNAIVTLYAVVVPPSEVIAQIKPFSNLVPREAFGIIETQLTEIAQQSETTKNLALALSVLFGLWSARKGTAALITACNVAYGEQEDRPIWKVLIITFVFTAAAIVGMVALGLTVISVPLILDLLPLGNAINALLHALRWPLSAVIFVLALQVIYRFAPNRAQPKWRWVSWGSVIATLLWLAASLLFSLYVRSFGNYNETYGAIGGAVVMILWFYISALVILLGAEVNAEMEHQTEIDSTTGPDKPMGERGAYVADTLGDKDD